MRTNEDVADAVATSSYGTLLMSMYYGVAAASYLLVVGRVLQDVVAGTLDDALDQAMSGAAHKDPPHPAINDFLIHAGMELLWG
jgi:hypothetical protein